MKPSNKNEVKKSINQLLLYPNVCEWFYFPLWPSTPEFTDWLVQYLCHWFVVRLQSGQLEKNHGNSTNSWYSFMIWHGYTLNFKCSILVPVFNAMNWTSRSNPKNNKIKKIFVINFYKSIRTPIKIQKIFYVFFVHFRS